MKYSDWLSEFIKDKREVPTPDTSGNFAIHSSRRYVHIERKDEVWEIAITYTGRLVVRSGKMGSDGITLEWNHWVTEQDAEVPRSFKLTQHAWRLYERMGNFFWAVPDRVLELASQQNGTRGRKDS